MTLDEGKITVFIPKENTKIEGRIKYKGYDYTPWISSDDPVIFYNTKLSLIFTNLDKRETVRRRNCLPITNYNWISDCNFSGQSDHLSSRQKQEIKWKI